MKNVFTRVIFLFVGIVIGVISVIEFAESEYKKEKKRADTAEYFAQKYQKMFFVLINWIRFKQKKRNFVSYLREHGYKRIAIYGMGDIGNILMEELAGTEVQVVYGIDQRADFLQDDIKIIKIDDPMEEVDVIVITAVVSADLIKLELGKRVNYPVISIEEIVE